MPSPNGDLPAGIRSAAGLSSLGLEQHRKLAAIGRDDVGQGEDGAADPRRRGRVQDGGGASGVGTRERFADNVERHLVADEDDVAGQPAQPPEAFANVARLDGPVRA